MYVCMGVWVCMCVYVCMSVCVSVCMYVCMYECRCYPLNRIPLIKKRNRNLYNVKEALSR